jgi:hypothetical protein
MEYEREMNSWPCLPKKDERLYIVQGRKNSRLRNLCESVRQNVGNARAPAGRMSVRLMNPFTSTEGWVPTQTDRPGGRQCMGQNVRANRACTETCAKMFGGLRTLTERLANTSLWRGTRVEPDTPPNGSTGTPHCRFACRFSWRLPKLHFLLLSKAPITMYPNSD